MATSAAASLQLTLGRLKSGPHGPIQVTAVISDGSLVFTGLSNGSIYGYRIEEDPGEAFKLHLCMIMLPNNTTSSCSPIIALAMGRMKLDLPLEPVPVLVNLSAAGEVGVWSSSSDGRCLLYNRQVHHRSDDRASTCSKSSCLAVLPGGDFIVVAREGSLRTAHDLMTILRVSTLDPILVDREEGNEPCIDHSGNPNNLQHPQMIKQLLVWTTMRPSSTDQLVKHLLLALTIDGRIRVYKIRFSKGSGIPRLSATRQMSSFESVVNLSITHDGHLLIVFRGGRLMVVSIYGISDAKITNQTITGHLPFSGIAGIVGNYAWSFDNIVWNIDLSADNLDAALGHLSISQLEVDSQLHSRYQLLGTIFERESPVFLQIYTGSNIVPKYRIGEEGPLEILSISQSDDSNPTAMILLNADYGVVGFDDGGLVIRSFKKLFTTSPDPSSEWTLEGSSTAHNSPITCMLSLYQVSPDASQSTRLLLFAGDNSGKVSIWDLK